MSDPSAFGFGQFVPGFDFLQNLSKTASTAPPTGTTGMPGMASWVAPTLSVEDIDKRIQELKSVLFWLEQNTTALKATIQAMEVQKMTLSTLQSMNVNMADLAKAFTAKPPVTEPETAEPPVAPKSSLFTPKPAAQTAATAPQPPTAPEADATRTADTPADKPAVDPMQWWGALTQQFQGIAAAALKDVAGEAMKTGMGAKNASTRKAPAKRKPATASAQASAAGTPGKPVRKTATVKAKAPKTARTPAKATPGAARQTVRK